MKDDELCRVKMMTNDKLKMDVLRWIDHWKNKVKVYG